MKHPIQKPIRLRHWLLAVFIVVCAAGLTRLAIYFLLRDYQRSADPEMLVQMIVMFVCFILWVVLWGIFLPARGGSNRSNPGTAGTGKGRWRGPL